MTDSYRDHCADCIHFAPWPERAEQAREVFGLVPMGHPVNAKRCEYSGYGKKEVDWRGIIGEEVENRVGAIIDEKADEIVDIAVKRVYDSIIRRKPFREACKKMDIIFDGLGGDDDGRA